MKIKVIVASCVLLFSFLLNITAFADTANSVYKCNEILTNPEFGGTKEDDWNGDRIFLGSYEQDGDFSNGLEPVLWRVLQVKNNKALLLSEYALDAKPFSETSSPTTWEKSSVRQWLNSDFYNVVFRSRGTWKKRYVLKTKLKAPDNPVYGTDGGCETIDKVFLLSWEDMYKEKYGFPKGAPVPMDNVMEGAMYGTVSKSRLCYPTLYTAEYANPLITRNKSISVNPYGEKVNGIGSIYYILRTPGVDQRYITYVSRWGRTTYNFLSPVDHSESCIRPAVWVDISKLNIVEISERTYCVAEDDNYIEQAKQAKNYKDEIIRSLTSIYNVKVNPVSASTANSFDEISNPVYGGNEKGEWEGDRVYFGQDNGKKLLWRVLQKSENRILLLSEYALEAKAFDESGISVWENSSVRNYLNNEWLEKVFSQSQITVLNEKILQNRKNKRYNVYAGHSTKDKVWLLSYDDIMNPAYGFVPDDTESNSRICFISQPKTVTKIFGKYDKNGNQIYSSTKLAVAWLLRTPGFSKQYISDVNKFGDVYRHEQRKANNKTTYIRPVIEIDLTNVRLEADNGYSEIVVQ